MIFDKEQLEIIRETHPNWFLDINRWYTNDFGLMVYAEKQEVGRQFLGYGTLGGGEPWQQRSSFVLNSDGVRLANKEEVLGALKKEAISRYSVGDTIIYREKHENTIKSDECSISASMQMLYMGETVVFEKGEWMPKKKTDVDLMIDKIEDIFESHGYDYFGEDTGIYDSLKTFMAEIMPDIKNGRKYFWNELINKL